MSLARRFISRSPSGVFSLDRRRFGSSTLSNVLRKEGPIDVHPEVQDALAHNRPVVALETTIVTHGMPFPVNLKTARSVESIVRKAGAIPATIGVVGGRVKIGLKPSELERLADVKNNPSVVKVSRRDIGPVVALKGDGVEFKIICAFAVKLSHGVFQLGNNLQCHSYFCCISWHQGFCNGRVMRLILQEYRMTNSRYGSVSEVSTVAQRSVRLHRFGYFPFLCDNDPFNLAMDISADLQELTRCPVGLVSAGVKSILDIGRTLEYLETLGVPVVSYGPTDDFPAFYSRRSGFKSPWRVNDPATAARVLYTHWQLGMSNGALFGVPIPKKYEAVGQQLQRSVEQALSEAAADPNTPRGKEATPWLLKRVGELTAGKSLASNIALIKNTASVGGKIAVEYARLRENHLRDDSSVHPKPQNSEKLHFMSPRTSADQKVPLSPAKIVVIGAAAVDITAQAVDIPGVDPIVGVHSTLPGTVSLTLGGVGRNVAEAAHRILSSGSEEWSSATALISPIGNDSFGHLLVDETKKLGMRTDGLMSVEAGSAVCNMIVEELQKHRPTIAALDANLSADALKAVVKYCNAKDIEGMLTFFFEPTSVAKSTAIFPAIAAALDTASPYRSPIAYVTPNILELTHMYQEASAGSLELTAHQYWWRVIDSMALGSKFRMDLEQLSRRNACDEVSTNGSLSFLLENGVAQMAINLLPFFRHLIIKCGDRGIVIALRVAGDAARKSAWAAESTNIRARQVVAHNKSQQNILVLKHFPAPFVREESIINVTGAGDSLVGSMLATLAQSPVAFEEPSALEKLVAKAQMAAVLTLQSKHAVSPALSTMGDP
ncbi:Pseudouridine-5'-phosphate glycosidase [Grifola frondosa]|uniref:Pseudouridine-5'-phosphate glycosidase n=1 Tax=Grifola frondosa TaxID=5627 RepID=A0A1C7MSG5_GRIFR|nr:Pseudouridine-5'-phosphate glycosidase [Grifola frondosa]